MKVAYNACFGGFDLSEKAKKRFLELKGEPWDEDKFHRDDEDLIKVIEELGKEASSELSNLQIKTFPGKKTFYIQEYDGLEKVVIVLSVTAIR